MLGRPIAHSLSPVLHRAAYRALGLDAHYTALDVGPDELGALLDGLDDDWIGLSLTMPLKQTALPLLDTLSPLARQVAAVNTVVLAGGARHGHNTDVAGMVEALIEAGVERVDAPVVLGGGATARSALAALAALGARRVRLVVRSGAGAAPELAASLGLALDVEPFEAGLARGADLVVSTLPAGAADALAEQVTDVPALLDVVYAPWPTALARACNGVTVGGAAMLLHQAAAQVQLMTGRAAPLEAMRAALETALAQRG